jgi:hypothetical protein
VEGWAALVPAGRVKVLGSQYGPAKLALPTAKTLSPVSAGARRY